ncbi:MAG TPA: ATP-binding protein [Oscillatoriaceae cyanobacterium]
MAKDPAIKRTEPGLMRPEDFGIGQLFERVPDAIIVRRQPGSRIVLWNPAAEAIFGYGEAEMLGRSFEELRTGPPVEAHRPFVQLEAQRKDGRQIVIELSWSPIVNSRVPGEFELAIARDVSARFEAEQALRESEALLRAFMDAGPVIAFMRDDEGRYRYTNRSHQRLLHSEDWIGTHVRDHFPPALAEEIRLSDRQVLESGRPGDFTEHIPHNGEITTILAYKFPFESHLGRLIGSVGIDVSALERARAEIQRKSDALERANAELHDAERYKDEFLSVLSHELRTPLNFIISYASVLDEGLIGPLTAEEHGYLAKVLRGADRLLVLVDNLLEMTRIAAGRFKVMRSAVLYDALVAQAIETLAPEAAEKGLSLRQDVGVDGEVWIDGLHVKQVLINLIDNAIKFTPRGGAIGVRAYRRDECLITEVTDTGIGIAAEDIPKLFTRFRQLDMSSTREAGGMGIGLALAKAIIQGHGGEIGVRSERGRGSTFWFTLPLRE